MSNYVIVTDSSCDLPAYLVEELEIHSVPLAFLFGEKTYYNYPDNREMAPKVFYDRLRAGEMATTNAINVGQVTDFLTPFLEQGLDVLILGFSSGLSTSYNSYCIAAEDVAEQYPDRTIRVVDTLCASLGQGMLVYQAAKLRQAGKSLEEVRDWLDQTQRRELMRLVDTQDQLKANLAQASFEAGFRLAMGLLREVEVERIRLQLEEEG